MADFGYAVFIWAATGLIGLYSPTPDIILTIFVYATFGILLKMARGVASASVVGAFGLVIALSYYTKVGTLALAPVFFLSASLLVKPRSIMFRRMGSPSQFSRSPWRRGWRRSIRSRGIGPLVKPAGSTMPGRSTG